MKFSMCLIAAALAVMFTPGIAHASGPVAIYALVDKVEFEPGATTPERIRISGVFITAAERSNVYSAPQRGYLYFTLPTNNRDLALREWNDLKAIAGTHQIVAFGTSWLTKARVRRPGERAAPPDDYAMGNGLVRMNADNPKARELLDYKDR